MKIYPKKMIKKTNENKIIYWSQKCKFCKYKKNFSTPEKNKYNPTIYYELISWNEKQ